MQPTDTTPRQHRPRAPKDPRARQAWILYQLNREGSSYAELARQHGLERSSPRKANTGRNPSMEVLVAAALGLRPEQIWPERYDAAGNRIPGVHRAGGRGKKSVSMRKHTRATKPRHVKRERGARQAREVLP